MQNISSYKNFRSVNSQEHIDILDALYRIKNGINSEPIIEARKALDSGDKEEYSRIKNTLPTFRFSALFNGSKATDATEHTGFICLDFDKFEDLDEMHSKMSVLREDKYTFALWLSPSNRGFKLLVKIPKSLENHKFYFNGLAEYYSIDEWDQSTSDITRHCFHSYDPKLFINKDSEEFKTMSGIVEDIAKAPVPVIKLKSKDKVITKVLKWFEPKFDSSARNASLYKLAAAFNRYGIDKGEALTTIISNYGSVVGSDNKYMTQAEFEKIVENGYSDSSAHNTAAFEDRDVVERTRTRLRLSDKKDEIKKSLRDEGRSDEEILNIIATAKEEKIEYEFWTSTEDKSGKVKLEIAPLKFKQFLANNGYYKYYTSDMEYIFVHITGRFVSETNEENVRAFVLDWAERNNPQLFDHIAKDTAKFDKKFLNLMYSVDVEFIKDDADSAKLFFVNKLVNISADDVSSQDYIDFPQYIWKDQIIDRDFEIGTEDCDYKQFIKDISGADKNGRHDSDHYNEDRYNSFRSTIGYLMHTYKRLDKAPAVILYDESSSETEVSGGTGKGLLYRSISEFKDSVVVDGKSFDSSKEFAWQRLSPSTQFVVLDDISKGFNFENIFSVITNGVTVNQKNKPAFFISPEDSPKIMITSNYVVNGAGSSHERRRHEVELFNYYHSGYTPADRFQKMMFVGWDESQWNGFNNFMVNCIQYYLENGLTRYDMVSVKERRVTSSVGDVLVEWATEYFGAGRYNKYHTIKDIFTIFKDDADERSWTQRKFTSKLTELAVHWKSTGAVDDYTFTKVNGKNTVEMIKEISRTKRNEDIEDSDLPF